MPILSVIIPAYNEDENIAAALDDVLRDVAPHVPDLEILVVDDGSRDRTAELARQAAASSSAPTGAHCLHRPALGFQQVCPHIQLPQRRHFWKSGLISSMAARRAASCCAPPTARCTS